MSTRRKKAIHVNMCGRYGRRADKQRIAEWMQTHDTNVFDDSYFAPSYNSAPQDMHPVVRLDHETGERELTVMRWGLIPYWSKDSKIGFSTINAKAETIATSPTMESGADFVAVDMPQANRFVVHIMAAVAEQEAEAISKRTRAALAAAKARGKVLGGRRVSKARFAEIRESAVLAKMQKAEKARAELLPVITKLQANGATSLRQIAAGLNAQENPHTARRRRVVGSSGVAHTEGR